MAISTMAIFRDGQQAHLHSARKTQTAPCFCFLLFKFF